jgi:hypothetical protein
MEDDILREERGKRRERRGEREERRDKKALRKEGYGREGREEGGKRSESQ